MSNNGGDNQLPKSSTASSCGKVETYLIIVKVVRSTVKEYAPNPVLGNFGLPIVMEKEGFKEEVIDRIPLTEPIIVLPEGMDITKAESFRIRKPTVIHTQNMKRILVP